MAGLLPPVRDIGTLRDPVRPFVALLALFGLLLLVFALFERLGLPSGYVPEAVLVSTFALFGLVALVAHARRPVDFYAADRNVAAPLGGMAGASGLVGLLAIGLAGGIFGTAAEMLVSAAGFLLAAVLLALFAPRLRRLGGSDLGDFLAARFGLAARLAGAAVAIASSVLLFLAVLKTAGPLVSALVGLPARQGLYVAAGLAALAVLAGGMRSLTWTQSAQYLVMALACLAPLGVLIAGQDGADGAGLFRMTELQARLTELLQPFVSGDGMAIALPVLLLAAGTASLPQMLARIFAAPHGRAAGISMLWSFALATLVIAAGLLLGETVAIVAGGQSAETSGDVLTRAMPLLVALPPILVGLVLAGLLAALLAAGQAALFSAASALSRDVWDEIIDRRGPAGRRILIARVLIVAVAYGAYWLAANWAIDAPALLGWALAFAAAGNLVPLLLGLFWSRCSAAAGACGIAAGFGVAAVAFLLDLGLVPGWREIGPAAGIGSAAAAALGLCTAFLVSVAVSLLGPAAPRDSQAGAAANSSRTRERLGHERPA